MPGGVCCPGVDRDPTPVRRGQTAGHPLDFGWRGVGVGVLRSKTPSGTPRRVGAGGEAPAAAGRARRFAQQNAWGLGFTPAAEGRALLAAEPPSCVAMGHSGRRSAAVCVAGTGATLGGRAWTPAHCPARSRDARTGAGRPAWPDQRAGKAAGCRRGAAGGTDGSSRHGPQPHPPVAMDGNRQNWGGRHCGRTRCRVLEGSAYGRYRRW